MTIKQITAHETWPLRHEVMWPEMDLDFVKLANDPDGTHFGLYVDHKLISVVSLFQTKKGILQFRKLATKASEQGKGYGSKLLQHLIVFSKEQGAKILWCNARSDKQQFYRKFNFTPTEQCFEKQGIQFVIMEKLM